MLRESVVRASMGDVMRLACLQFASVPFDREQNLRTAQEMVQSAAKDGAQLAVLPEVFSSGYEYNNRLHDFAEALDGPTLEWMKSAAKGDSIWLVGGFIEKSGNRTYDSLALVSPAGQIWTYRKRFIPFFEKFYFTGGRSVGLFDTEIGRIGVMICWDMIHSRLIRELKGKIDVLLICSAWPDVRTGSIRIPGLETWLARPPLNRPRELALQLGVPVAYCNMSGDFATRVPVLGVSYSAEFAGTSTIIDQYGNGTIGPHRENALVIDDVQLRNGETRRRAA